MNKERKLASDLGKVVLHLDYKMPKEFHYRSSAIPESIVQNEIAQWQRKVREVHMASTYRSGKMGAKEIALGVLDVVIEEPDRPLHTIGVLFDYASQVAKTVVKNGETFEADCRDLGIRTQALYPVFRRSQHPLRALLQHTNEAIRRYSSI